MPDDHLETLAAFQRRMTAMPARRAQLIADARNGHSWQQIADALVMTLQGARKAATLR